MLYLRERAKTDSRGRWYLNDDAIGKISVCYQIPQGVELPNRYHGGVRGLGHVCPPG